MKVKLENREYELKANGRFLLKYKEIFHQNAVADLYKCLNEHDVVLAQMLTYCAIGEEKPFEEWLDSFETPLFILPCMEEIIEYLVRSVNPTVAPNSKSSDEKKTTN